MVRKMSVLVIYVFVSIFGASGLGVRAQAISLTGPNSAPPPAQWYVSPAGNDGNDCTSPATPCATIPAAMLLAAGGDTILVASGTYTNTVQSTYLYFDKSLSLSGGWDSSFSSQAGHSTIHGQRLGTCVDTVPAIDVSITRFIFQDCGDYTQIGQIYPQSISNHARLSLANSVVENGAHIKNWNDGDLSLVDSLVRNNASNDSGGGIDSPGILTINRSAIMKNYTNGSGGGINTYYADAVIINSTISENTGGFDGGISKNYSGELKIYNSTIVHNKGSFGTGGLNNMVGVPLVWLYNSIIANNDLTYYLGSSDDCAGTITSGGYNMIGNVSGCGFIPTTGDKLNESPNALPWDSYYALLPGSPAVDAGNPAGCKDDLGNTLLVDQRNSPRPLDGDLDGVSTCDIGAYELNPQDPLHVVFLPFTKNSCPILYFDNFSDPTSGWPIGDNGNVRFEYINSEYRILIRPANYIAAARPGFAATTYKASVDVRNVAGVNGSYGIIFGLAQDWSSFYSFEIYSDGWYGIYWYQSDGNIYALNEGTSPWINLGTATNHLRLDWSDNLVIPYVNGHSIVNLYLPTSTVPLGLGLINFAYNQPNLDTRYANFKVVPPSCSDITSSGTSISSASPSWFAQPSVFNQLQGVTGKHTP